MNFYAFELGRAKDLCFAELIAVLGKSALVERNLDTAIFQLRNEDFQVLQNRLGGTIKIVEIAGEFDYKSGKQPYDSIKLMTEDLLQSAFVGREGKIPFSVSTLSFKDPMEINIKQLLNFSKIFLKSLGLNSRFVNKNFKNTRPSTIYKARVLEKGIDINIIKGDFGKIFVGKTIAIQDIDAYSSRDYGKPHRDAKVGMLPPKLAQVMINLSGVNSNKTGANTSVGASVGKTSGHTIFDPFCGTGTVLMEGMLMGVIVIGSDIAPKMVDYSEKNCEWLKSEFGLSSDSKTSPGHKSSSGFRVFERDARFLNKNVLPEKIDVIVTEGYLGKLFSKSPSELEQEMSFRELANLHLNWLSATRPLLPAKGKIVMCTTAYRIGQKLNHFPHFEELAGKAGYKILANFSYSRPDQIVARDIRILEKL